MDKFRIDPEFRDLIPRLTDEERRGLKRNIRKWGGARDPLVVWEGLLLDGHNRYRICKKLELPFRTCPPKETIETRDDAKIWIIRNQLGRRNLPTHALARFGNELKKLFETQAKEAQHEGQKSGGRGRKKQNSGQDSGLSNARKTARKAAKAARTSHEAMRQVAFVDEHAPKVIRAALDAQEISLNDAFEATRALGKLPEDMRLAAIKIIEDTHKLGKKFSAKKAIQEVKLAAKRALAEHIRKNPTVTPDGRYQVIMVDPPWKYDSRAEDTTHRGKNLYPDMTVEEICELPVAKFAQKNCVLWLWTTNAFMRSAYECLDAWGFEEKTILTWDKVNIGLGDWLRNVTEHCILAVRGKPVVSLTNQTTLISEKRRQHSRKPETFYKLVEKLCPGSKLEMFARANRKGWTAWGAEAEKFDAAE